MTDKFCQFVIAALLMDKVFYFIQFEEPLNEKRARLVYQSRKRGMLENGLLLGKILFLY